MLPFRELRDSLRKSVGIVTISHPGCPIVTPLGERGTALEVRLLGPPEVLVDGRPLRVDTRKAVALLAYLAVTSTPHSRDVLATLLWPGDDPDRARGSLRRTLSTLRSALADRWIRADREWVSFEPETGVFVDIDSVRDRLGEIGEHGHPEREVCTRCVPILNDAANLHRGDFLAGFSLRDSPDWDDWQSAQAEMHRRSLGGILERLAIGQAAAGMYRQAIDAAERWLSLDTLDEAAHRQLMLLNAWAGDRASAMEQYLKAVRVLDEELGVPPLPETTELNDAILEDDIPPAPSAERRVTVAPERPLPVVESPVIPLVGRESDLAVLRAERGRVRFSPSRARQASARPVSSKSLPITSRALSSSRHTKARVGWLMA